MEAPWLAALLTVPVMLVLGYALQRLVLNRALRGDALRPVLVTLGLSVIVQNLLQQYFSADAQRLQAGGLEAASLQLPAGVNVGLFPLLTFGVSVVVIALLQWVLDRTSLGRQFRATADDGEVASLMGVDERHVFALATALAFAVVAVAGMLMGVRSSFAPTSGPEQLILAFAAVIVGGMGSLWGTLAGGLLIGLAQSIGSRLGTDLQLLAGHAVFLAVLMLRPQGLFNRAPA
jgi:branched-chain amino acid transport system permease protein